MHAIFFGLKRAHHGTLRLTRNVLAALGLTAARFDLLYAVKRSTDRIVQSTLRTVLGVSRATVSRMLSSLEELGLIRRTVLTQDRRQRVVELTTKGRWRIAFAHRQLTRSGWAQLAVDSALGGDNWCDEGDCGHAIESLQMLLDRIRAAFGDHATLEYPWGPDEDSVTWWDYYDHDLLDFWIEPERGSS
jgi:DNA-binding MarR family transcriptional regulator